MKKVLFIAAALFVCSSFSFASDLESESFDAYSFSPLTVSALDYVVMPLATAEWSTTDSQNLANIETSLTSTLSGTVLGKLYQIKDSTDYMPNMNNQLNYIADILGYGDSVSAYPSIYSLLYANNELVNSLGRSIVDPSNSSSLYSLLNSFYNYSTQLWRVNWGYFDANGSYQNGGYFNAQADQLAAIAFSSLAYDTVLENTSAPTLYSLISKMQRVLASDDDVALAASQKANREEIEDSFLNGSSGSTSLGASDFGDLSDVGGTVNDTLSLNGQASISSFTSGLSGADQEGQNWFSAATRDSLDSVTGGISTFALDDSYNMEGWEEQYSWVLGGE